MQRIFILSLSIIAFALSACGSFQTVKDSWKYTRKQYRTYLNTPVELDLEDTGSCELYELALSEAVIDVDEGLQKLVRAMENSDHNPDQVWVMNIMQQVPWLSGVALIDKSGAVVAQYPEYFSKPFDASPLVEPDPKQRLGALRAYVQMSDAGPEVYVGNPVYAGQDLRGLIVTYFDPRVLVTISSAPGSFMIASPAGVLWPGRFAAGNIVGATDWANVLKDKSCGIVGNKGDEFFWTTRYVGNLPIVYALPTSAGRESLLPGETSSQTAVTPPPLLPAQTAPAGQSAQNASSTDPQQMPWPAQVPDFSTPLTPAAQDKSAPAEQTGAQKSHASSQLPAKD